MNLKNSDISIVHLILKIFVSLVCLCCSNAAALESFILNVQHQPLSQEASGGDTHGHHHGAHNHHHTSHHTTHHQGHHSKHKHDDGTEHSHGFSIIDLYRVSDPLLPGAYSSFDFAIANWSFSSQNLSVQEKDVERRTLLYESEVHWLMSMLIDTLNLSPNAPPRIY